MIFLNSIPPPAPDDIIEWADSSGIKVDGHSFDSTRTPQLIKPIRAMADADTRIGTLVKPVQVGGSTAGEIVCGFWGAFSNGLIQYNWQNDDKAKDRWLDRIKQTLESCKDIKRNGARFEELICEARYVNTTVRVQGVFNESSLDSDTVPLQINEEIHLWKPGFLGKARRRQTQVWNAKAFDISNASNKDDQLHSAYEDGTMEEWEVLCPSCGKYHEMRFRFNPAKEHLGGLRWDSSDCKMGNGRYNYNKLEKTIRYQFPCGHTIKDIPSERRQLKGRYSAPKNEGAHISHRSWNFEAVSCDAIRWLTLIQEWHSAIRAQKSGDTEPIRRFVTERECKFYSDESRPFQGQVLIRTGLKKSREGLPGRVARLWAADKQRGYRRKGEIGHYWLVIRDVKENADSQLVFEGLVQTDTDLLAILEDHGCKMRCGCIDGTWDKRSVEEFCYRNNINMILGAAKQSWFYHKATKSRHFYSEPEPLYAHMKMPDSKFPYSFGATGAVAHSDEPHVWLYNKAGCIDNLLFLRNHRQNIEAAALAETPPRVASPSEYIAHDVPEDVSEDYKNQNDSWELRAGNRGRSKEAIEEWRQTRDADHMLLCEAYIATMMAMEGFIAERLTQLGVNE